MLLHVVAPDHGDDREPLRDYDTLMHELAVFDEHLSTGPMVVVLGKLDLPEAQGVSIDPDQVRDAVRNLVRNAVQHTPTGGTVGRTRSALRRARDHVAENERRHPRRNARRAHCA